VFDRGFGVGRGLGGLLVVVRQPVRIRVLEDAGSS